ncbi:MAG: hypothetical protein RJB38_1600 [Pseudomonadota bacterium]
MARKPVSSKKRPTSDRAARSSRGVSSGAPNDLEAHEDSRALTKTSESDPELLEDSETEEADWIAEEESTTSVNADPQLPALSSRDVQTSFATDPLQRYLEEVRRYPMLDPETEMSLAERMHSLNDIEAAKALVQANLRLVVKIAFEYQNMSLNLLDLIQEGNIGLMKAVSKFDPAKNVKLGYYATWWIRSYILKYLLDNFRLVKIGTTQSQKKLFYHLMREKQRLEAQGLFAGPKLLAERLNVREKDVVEMEQRLSARGVEVSLDAPTDPSSTGNHARTLQDTMPDQAEAQDQLLEREQWLQILGEHLPAFREELNEKERRILDERLLSDEPKTLQEIGDRYGLTRERARQIEAKLLEKLRKRLQAHLSEPSDP